MQDKSISLEDHFLDVLSVEIANYERIAHLFEDADEARLMVDPVVVDSRKLTKNFIRRQRISAAGKNPYVIYCRKGGKGEKGDCVSNAVQPWYGEEMILRAVKRIVERGFYSRYQIEEAVARIGALGWVPTDSEEGKI